MGSFSRIPVGITFAAGNSSPRKDSIAWYQRRGIKVSFLVKGQFVVREFGRAWYITQSYQPNWQIRLMSAVSPVIRVSGTCPAVMYMLLVVQERIIAISIIQWSQSFFGKPVLIISLETPRLSSRIHPSAACIHGE